MLICQSGAVGDEKYSLGVNTRNFSRIGIKTWMIRTRCTPWASGARTTSAQITFTGGSQRAQGHSVLEVFGQFPKRRNTNMCFLKTFGSKVLVPLKNVNDY